MIRHVPNNLPGEGRAMIVGNGQFKYRIVEDWAKLSRTAGPSKKSAGSVSTATITSTSSTVASTR